MKLAKRIPFMTITLSIVASIVFTTAAAKTPVYNGADVSPAANLEAGVTTSAGLNIILSDNKQLVLQLSNAAEPINAIDTETATDSAAALSPEASAAAQTSANTTSSSNATSDVTLSQTASEALQGTLVSAGQQLVDFSQQFNGARYVYGSASPKVGFDCSGLVYYVYKQFGCTLPRTASQQYGTGVTVEKENLQPGDLVFFATYGGHSVSHVGIYIGNNLFIHAATSHQGVIVSNLSATYWAKTWVGAKRLITEQTSAVLSFESACFNAI